ncbi:hypothetical protein LX69_00747 [Breznakibacter xylanolyticus]|uniref:YgjP-like metallopeptidase domain-containing protein n=1 Tax=Breznakibacter xylanolyticus TaxID=990 RepID=A0A2W7NI01_9BACT|nr:SprT family zinc-dependent metalloprotease [Breznakibacter xylanolyticus]MBN2742962.1 M48 family metallopeptidase [Marinilabiliaceae bacterium]PZX19480.1 hypothetical protein LX69_00747 [Breznakibacter xylanolyticus]
MLTKDLVNIDGVGPVMLVCSQRASRLSIRVKPFKGIEVVFPFGTSPRQLSAFIENHRQWMLDAIQKVKQHEHKQTIFDESTVFKTRFFALKIEPDVRHNVQLTFKNGLLHVRYPSHMSVATSSIQEVIRGGIEQALRYEAKSFLPKRTFELAQQHGFAFNTITVKNLKSRWGSCSGKKNINLNLHLMRLPDHLIDYVLLHELCHTVEMNHGPRFKALLDKVTVGQRVRLEAEMKNQRTVVY